jgi:hypothetical protein
LREEKINCQPCPLEDSIKYPSGLLKLGDYPKKSQQPNSYLAPDLDCITKNDQETESAISVAERQSLIVMASYREKAAEKKRRNVRTRRRSGPSKTVQDRTYGNFDTTVFDVRRAFIKFLNDMKSGSRKPKIPGKRVVALRTIAHELRQRMEDAEKTLPEAMGDLEAARRKLVDNGGAGTIASLVAAIRLKNGLSWDKRFTKPMTLEYDQL